MPLVTSFVALVQPVATVFTAPTFVSLLIVLTGWVFARRLDLKARGYQAPPAMLRYSLIVWWFAGEGHRRTCGMAALGRGAWRPWYRSQRAVCFTDRLNTLRRERVREHVL